MSRNDAIREELEAIERSNDVTVLYACESGSRAWGFESVNSDYDVRFVYLHRPDWYLSVDLETRRDVIERPIDDLLDVSGWDLRKALGLLRKSNPPLLEWLASPIVYRDDGVAADRLRALAADCYSPRACAHHYLNMAKATVRSHLRGEEVIRKKYFYALRPLLAVQWLKEGRGLVPTEFSRLLDACVSAGPLRETIDELVTQKRAAVELASGPRLEILHEFIDASIAEADAGGMPAATPGGFEPFNQLFRDELKRVYG